MTSLTHLVRAALGVFVAAVTAAAQSAGNAQVDVEDVLRRAGERVEQSLARAQTIVSTETVAIQPLSAGMMPEGFARRVVSELRTSWAAASDSDEAAEAQIERRVLKVNGRPPKPSKDSCTVPEQRTTQTQPLSMLLPKQRESYAFIHAGFGRSDGRRAILVDYRELARVTVDARVEEDNKDCVGFDVTGGMRGRIWIDAETFDVLRLDQHLGGLVDVKVPREALRYGGDPVWTLERLDQTLQFKPVFFREPDEVLVLPVQLTELNILRRGSVQRTRTTTHYTNYLRMLTGGRVIDAREIDSPQ